MTYKKLLVELRIHNYIKNIYQGFRLKNTDDTRNYFLEEIKQNDLINKKPKEVCTTLNYIEDVPVLASIITGGISIFAFASLYLLFL